MWAPNTETHSQYMVHSPWMGCGYFLLLSGASDLGPLLKLILLEPKEGSTSLSDSVGFHHCLVWPMTLLMR